MATRVCAARELDPGGTGWMRAGSRVFVGYPERIDAPPTSLLDLSEVTLRYPNGILALGGVSLRLGAGEFVSVVGPSGCGKSTLLHIAAGLTQPSTGVATGTSASVGYVFQDATLLPWRSVARNVELLGELHRLPRGRRRERARAAIDRVGLSEFAGHKPATLSGGMRMRAALARALTLEPDLFLFDEPFGALDELTRQRLGEQLLELFIVDRFGALLVTHSITEAVFLSSRVLVMSPRPGRVVAQVPVSIGYPRPAEVRFSSEFTAAAARVAEALRRTGDPAGDRSLGQDVPA